MTVAVPLPTVTFCVHEVSGVEEVEATSVAGPTPEKVTASEVVPGDLVVLSAGDMIPADGRVLELLRGLPQIGLSPRELECVRLRMEDLRYDEIAGVLGLSAGTVGALLARAHGKIRKAVGGGLHKDRDIAQTAAGKERYAS